MSKIKQRVYKTSDIETIISLIIKDSKKQRKIYPIQVPVEFNTSIEKINSITNTHINDILVEDLYFNDREIPTIYYIALNRPAGRFYEVYGIVYKTKNFIMDFNTVSGSINWYIANPNATNLSIFKNIGKYIHQSPH